MKHLAKLIVATLMIIVLIIAGKTLVNLGELRTELYNQTIENKKELIDINKLVLSSAEERLDIRETQTFLLESGIATVNLISKINSSEVKPSYQYLKDVTVYIKGEVLPERTSTGSTVLGESWSGTGTIVAQRNNHSYVLTNAHVAGKNKLGDKRLTITMGDKEINAMVFSYHEEFDLATLLVFDPLTEKKTIKGINTQIKPSDKAYSVGNYLGLPYIYTEGTFAGYYEDYYDFNMPTAFGCSGSGVFDKDGKLISVVFAIHSLGWKGVDTTKAITVPGSVVQEYISWLGYYGVEPCLPGKCK